MQTGYLCSYFYYDFLICKSGRLNPGRGFVNNNFAQVGKDILGFVKYHNVMKKYDDPEKYNIKLIVDNNFVLEK